MAKGQFYLLTGLIFIFFIFSLSGSIAYLSSSSDPFLELKNNYVIEANKCINSAINQERDPFLYLDEFSKNYMLYAKTRGMDFRFVYVLSQDNTLKIVNYLNNNIDIYYKDRLIFNCNNGPCNPVLTNNLAQLDWLDEITLKFSDKSYTFYFTDPKNIEFKVLFKGEFRR